MDDSQNINIAKVILLSSALSVLITLLILFSVRHVIGDVFFAVKENESEIPQEQIVANDVEPVVEAVAKINPAVVSVVITKDVPVYEQYYETFNPFGLFGGISIPRVRESGTEEREVGGGSGFIVSRDGMIVTNHHVVADESARYSVLLNDGTVYTVDVLARDEQLDIAILKINEPLLDPLVVAEFGDSNAIKLGQTVIAIGNALAEFQNSVSVGVVSGLSRSIVATDAMGQAELLDHVIQTDAAINPGNSGGPLVDISGEVIGVSVATSRGADNIGFAIPAQVVKQAVDSVREYGEIVRPYLGVRYVMVNEAVAERLELPVSYGALISSGDNRSDSAIIQNSPADKAGLQEGDIILAIDGEELRNVDLSSILRRKIVGEVVTLLVLRGEEETTVPVTLERSL